MGNLSNRLFPVDEVSFAILRSAGHVIKGLRKFQALRDTGANPILWSAATDLLGWLLAPSKCVHLNSAIYNRKGLSELQIRLEFSVLAGNKPLNTEQLLRILFLKLT